MTSHRAIRNADALARNRLMRPDDILERFFERQPGPDLPFVLQDEVEVTEGVYVGRQGEVVLLAYAETPMQYLVEFEDGTDEQFPATSLKLLHRAA